MMAIFDPSIPGIFIFGLIAGICPCNIAIALGLIGYLSSDKASLSPAAVLKLVVAFSLGTVLVLLPLGYLAGLAGRYLLFLNGSLGWALSGLLLILMGFQLLRVYQLPNRGIFNFFKQPESYTVAGTFLIGIAFGAITIVRVAPMLLIVLTYIALYQTPVAGLVTMLIYSISLSVPLIVISSTGGILGKKIKDILKIGGNLTDRIIGFSIILVGLYLLYLAIA